ncbi:hypothetical protein F544_20650 [Bibersteinia trehalosi USDA-ARS-USMARC-190]|uniref:Uncharacterized protein n=1 Tax=Bibersteinia trehalosi USDA-ARS-USMARC-190 TaxID=1263832 RepID=W0RD32_BIBTR|nr:hypothetical protein F544_20650 [Bibersteinia trehalosi USDA-ARS-USMARC-190]
MGNSWESGKSWEKLGKNFPFFPINLCFFVVWGGIVGGFLLRKWTFWTS